MAPFYLDRPLNFGHRGASHDAPQNTLAAFIRAAELGADGIEFDVQLSGDGHAVIIHDLTVDATTDGHGSVRAKTLAELKTLDAGAWFDPRFTGERIPTLQEVIDAVGDRLLLNVELKPAGLSDAGLAAAVVRAIEKNNLLHRVVVSSFEPLSLWQVKRLNPRVPTGLLYSPDMPFFLRRPWFRHLARPDALHPEHRMVDEASLRWAKRHGYRVNVWTADDPDEMHRLIRAGVDAIITNRPDVLGRVLASAA